MGKMYKINKSQLVNKKVFSHVYLSGKKMEDKATNSLQSAFSVDGLPDLRSQTRWLACGPQAYPRITCHAKNEQIRCTKEQGNHNKGLELMNYTL